MDVRSLSRIVTVAVSSLPITTLESVVVSVAENISVSSILLSSTIGTLTEAVVSPGRKVTVSETGSKSDPSVKKRNKHIILHEKAQLC